MDERKGTLSVTDLDRFLQQTRETEEDANDLNRNLFEAALALPNVGSGNVWSPGRRSKASTATPAWTKSERNSSIPGSVSSWYTMATSTMSPVISISSTCSKTPPDIQSILHPIPAVPESMSATDLINKFSRERKSIAWVVDEFGGTAGIVTMEDLLEEIFGDIRDEYDTEEFEEKKLSNDEFIFSGRLELDYINKKYGLELPERRI